jgi:hypothetical protein
LTKIAKEIESDLGAFVSIWEIAGIEIGLTRDWEVGAWKLLVITGRLGDIECQDLPKRLPQYGTLVLQSFDYQSRHTYHPADMRFLSEKIRLEMNRRT